MNPSVFREYDIRGVADRDLTDDFVADLGRAAGAYLRATSGARRITLGRDCRLSSPRLHATLQARAAGRRASTSIDVGIVHTPLLYFAVFHLEADGGVMITGSHNPAEDNGFKIVAGKTHHLRRRHPEAARAHRAARASAPAPRPARRPTTTSCTDYVAYVADNIQLGPRRFKVVVDAGNGTGGAAAVPIL